MKRKTKDLQTIINEFIDYEELKGVSRATIGMNRFAISCYNFDTLTKENIIEFIRQIKDSDLSLSTKNIRIGHFRVFLYWCMNEGYLEPFKVNLLKGQDPKMKFFTDEEVNLLLTRPSNTFGEQRMYTVCCLICRTGARLSTILNLKLEDLDFKERTITFRHLKNKKSVILPMTDNLKHVLKQWTTTWDLNEYVFSDIYGEQMTVSNFETCFRRYCIDRGVKPRGPHALRHAFRRMYIKNGGDRFTLQRLLTHSSMEMTRRYVELFSEDLRKPLETFSPLDNMKRRINRVTPLVNKV